MPRVKWLFLAVCGATVIVGRAVVITQAGSPYFPPSSGEWARIEPSKAGWDRAALEAALAYAGRVRSSGVVVLLDGRIIAERDWRVAASPAYSRLRVGTTPDGHAIEDVESAQKSVVAFLAGIAEGTGQLNLSAPVSLYLGKGWSKANAAAESSITVRHLMTMTSGLNDYLEYQRPAGTVWRYNTGAYSRMIGVLEKATETDINTLTRNWLTTPIGMVDSRWAPRPWAAGNDEVVNSIAFVTTPRDLARFGLVVLAGGKWGGQDLLRDSGYLKRMLTPSQALNPSYGLLWWLNGQSRIQFPEDARARSGSLIAGAPSDLVMMMGSGDKRCDVVSSLHLVVTRLGDLAEDTPASQYFDDEFWRLLMKAVKPKA